MCLQENTLFDLGVEVTQEMLPSTLYIIWPIQVQSLKLLSQTEIHLQEKWRTYAHIDGNTDRRMDWL